MSLTSLEKRAVLKPVEAELDRQKEKVAAVKKRLKGLQDAVAGYIIRVEYSHGTLGVQGLKEALKESTTV